MPELEPFMEQLIDRNPAEEEFHQAVREVAEKVIPFLEDHPEYVQARVLERLVEPDRMIIFRVAWEDDGGEVHVNRGYRVQHSNAIGPYKGGLRFDPAVNLSVLKFLAFEQVLKNSLTTLPMGGAKGGSDFNPKERSDREVARFCQAFMGELFRHIGRHVDVPAGDIGVGTREIGYLFGTYKRIQNEFTGALTGKGPAFGGSLIRTEATGYGCVYFAREMLDTRGEALGGKVCLVSGAGNVALYAAEKLIEFGAKVATLSDRTGTLHLERGIGADRLAKIKQVKVKERGSLGDYADSEGLDFLPGETPWSVPCDAAFPCATQNEIDRDAARELLGNGCELISEGANMPASHDAARAFEDAGILYGPGKAANAGGVAISGLELTQNAMRLTWTRDEVDERLQKIMKRIHEQCSEHGREKGRINYVKGANIAGFIKVADAMLAYGVM
ncbi:MAG: NADP-specific glutamate dehydrogenase [Longimicrobiaceae bacterium]